MADRLRCLVVAAVAAAVLALPAGASAAKPHGKQACRSAAHKAKPPRRCQSRPRPQSRGTDPEHVAPAAIMDAGPATRAGAVLEI